MIDRYSLKDTTELFNWSSGRMLEGGEATVRSVSILIWLTSGSVWFCFSTARCKWKAAAGKQRVKLGVFNEGGNEDWWSQFIHFQHRQALSDFVKPLLNNEFHLLNKHHVGALLEQRDSTLAIRYRRCRLCLTPPCCDLMHIRIDKKKKSWFKSACQELGHEFDLEEQEVWRTWLGQPASHWHSRDEHSSLSHMSKSHLSTSGKKRCSADKTADNLPANFFTFKAEGFGTKLMNSHGSEGVTISQGYSSHCGACWWAPVWLTHFHDFFRSAVGFQH